MSETVSRRRKALAELIRTEPAASQEELIDKLAAQGFPVTQATVSRDLDQLGAIKLKRGGVSSYALPDQIGGGDWAAGRLDRILAEWVQSIETAGNLLVFKTPPGSAHLVALALDQSDLPELAGTISGDDTIFAALRDGVVPGLLAERFRTFSSSKDKS